MKPPVVGKRNEVEVGRKYRFMMRAGEDRWGTVRQVMPDAYVVALTEPLAVAGLVMKRGDQCLIDRRVVTGVVEVP